MNMTPANAPAIRAAVDAVTLYIIHRQPALGEYRERALAFVAAVVIIPPVHTAELRAFLEEAREESVK